MSGDLTLVLQSWKKRRRNYRVLFGKPLKQVRLDWHRSVMAFERGQIFGYERWKANKFGTQFWSISVLQTASSRSSVCRVPGIKPGAIVLLHVVGKDNCKAILKTLDTLKKTEKIDEVSPDKWRLIGHDCSSAKRLKRGYLKAGSS